MLRAATLSLILLATVATMLPAGEWLTEAARRAAVEQSHTRRHSRAWWRRRRAQLRRQHALALAQRRRRWAVRRRAVSRTDAPVRLTLAQTLRPVEMPDASPSSLDSIALITQQVTAPTQLIVVAAQTPLATLQTTADANASTTAKQTAHAAPMNTTAKSGVNAKSNSPAATNVNATAQASAASTNARPAALAQTTRASSANHPATPNATVSMNTNAMTNAVNAPAPNSQPQIAPAMPMLAHAPQVVAPLVKLSAPAPVLVGRDPRKFSALPAPRNWVGVSSTLGGEYKFSLRASDGRQSGVAVWSRLSLAAQPTLERRNTTFAGVAHSSLRRTVIDRMIAEGGWVVNDFEREIAGQKVYVVVAQSESGGLRRAWTYYFVDLDGQLFSLSSTAPTEFADSVASEAEQTLAALALRHASQH
jgi:hypothetical protein